MSTRAARALIGWMQPDEARLWLAGRRADSAHHAAFDEMAMRLRANVAARATFVPPSNVESALPEALAAHVAALQADPAVAKFLANGGRVAMVDLRTICAVQHHVLSASALERVASVAHGDPLCLAALTIPLPVNAALPAQYDPLRKTWILNSPNPNLQITSLFGGPVPDGRIVFGFSVDAPISRLSVAAYRGRYILRDGYHRAHGLLSRGIHAVPALVTDVATIGELGIPTELLGEAVYLGARPPLLPDYADDAVSADIRVPFTQKMIVIQGIEFATSA